MAPRIPASVVLLGLVLSGMFVSPPDGRADDEVQPAMTKKGDVISPVGQPKGDDIIGQPARYYIWRDDAGWHVRTTAPEGVKARFQGTIRLSAGKFQKLRSIGLETKANDEWQLNDARKVLKFDLRTTNSFDGFDFTIDDDAIAPLFDFQVREQAMPNRVFIGVDRLNPTAARFTLAP